MLFVFSVLSFYALVHDDLMDELAFALPDKPKNFWQISSQSAVLAVSSWASNAMQWAVSHGFYMLAKAVTNSDTAPMINKIRLDNV